jgi:uncharacterized protein YgfB (UPF0149 family)
MTSVTLPELAALLAEAGESPSASECHGVLCGALCVHAVYDAERWLEEVLVDGPGGVAVEPFAPIVAETAASLRGDQMTFQPVLPDDAAPIAQRADALGEWCEGFLFGLGTGALPAQSKLPAEVLEVLRDLAQISRAASGAEESDEENESAYAELVEFVRVAVQLVHDELAEHRVRAHAE